MVRAVFLDRDGTLNDNDGYVCSPEEMRLFPFSAEAVSLLNGAGFLVLLVTNQSGIARGYFTEETLSLIHDRLSQELAARGARLDGIYHCSAHPDDNDPCRKPNPGMVLKAASDFSLTLPECFLVGDKLSDLKTAWAAGSTALLVLTGEGRKTLADLTGEEREKSLVFDTLLDAARWICRRGVVPLKAGENP